MVLSVLRNRTHPEGRREGGAWPADEGGHAAAATVSRPSCSAVRKQEAQLRALRTPGLPSGHHLAESAQAASSSSGRGPAGRRASPHNQGECLPGASHVKQLQDPGVIQGLKALEAGEALWTLHLKVKE